MWQALTKISQAIKLVACRTHAGGGLSKCCKVPCSPSGVPVFAPLHCLLVLSCLFMCWAACYRDFHVKSICNEHIVDGEWSACVHRPKAHSLHTPINPHFVF